MNLPHQYQRHIDKNFLNQLRLNAALESGEMANINQTTKFLPNYLEYYEDYIDKLITKLGLCSHNLSDSSDILLLNAICYSSDADCVLIIQEESENKWNPKINSDLNNYLDDNSYTETVSIVLSTIQSEDIHNNQYHGIYQVYENNRTSKIFIAVPLQKSPQAEVMVVCGLPIDSELLIDIYAVILKSFYNTSKKQPTNIDLIEAAIIDNLKSRFGFISASLYQRRLKLFRQRLKQMVVYFEPLLHLEIDDLFISGWEALARDPKNNIAPSDLFTAAELWGYHFTVELDQHFLTIATESYQHARKLTQRRAGDVVPLSVNVYPESIMQPAYFETVKQIIIDKVISPRNLILEISEKSELPQYDKGIYLQNPLQTFKIRLLEYVSQFKIRFAIDDFGVGYASVSRLAGLNPSHVKIDRELLHHNSSEIIIRFVHELVESNNLNPAKVIVEGIDEKTPFSLRSLRDIGVSYIQGHLVGKPQPEVYRLTQEKYDELKKMLLH